MPDEMERRDRTERDVIELKAGAIRTDLAISKIGDSLEALTKIVGQREAERNSALPRALGIIVSGMVIIGGVVAGASYLVGASQDAKSSVREYRLSKLEEEFHGNIHVTYAWKTYLESKTPRDAGQ